jgi:hypothetical protein
MPGYIRPKRSPDQADCGEAVGPTQMLDGFLTIAIDAAVADLAAEMK